MQACLWPSSVSRYIYNIPEQYGQHFTTQFCRTPQYMFVNSKSNLNLHLAPHNYICINSVVLKSICMVKGLPTVILRMTIILLYYYTVACEYYYYTCMFLIMWHSLLLRVHGSSLDDFQQALTAPQAQLERVEII